MDSEEYRRFQEFQRFQDYQRFVEAQGNGQAPVSAQPPQDKALATQLDGMRQQLARIERVTNPPMWRKILRSKWLHRAAWLVIVIILATWGVPKLIEHYFGNGSDNTPPSQAALPATNVGQSGELETPKQTIHDVYQFIAEGNSKSLCGITMNARASGQFARIQGTQTCAGAVAKLNGALTTTDEVNQYVLADTSQLPDPHGNTYVVTSCQLAALNPPLPPLATFTLTKQAQTADSWQITNVTAPIEQCPATPSLGSTPPS